MAPFADVVYGTDLRWWRYHYRNVADICAGKLYVGDPNAHKVKPWPYSRLEIIAGTAGEGLADEPPIHYGSNSGYAAVNLVYALYNPARIILIGYDMGVMNGKPHFFGSHPDGMAVNSAFKEFLARFSTIDPKRHGIEIINATPGGALEHFPRMELEEALAKSTGIL